MRYFIVQTDTGGNERIYHLKDSLTVGRSGDCHIRVDMEGVSRRHCVIRNESSKITLEDLGSTNGTFLNGTRVEQAVVRLGDWIVVGPMKLQLLGGGGEEDAGAPGHTQLLGQTTIEALLNRDEEQLPTVQSLADAGLENRSIEALFKLTEIMNTIDDREDLLLRSLSILMDLLDMDMGSIYYSPEKRDFTKPVARVNKSGCDRYPPSSSVLKKVLEENVSVVATDLLRNEELSRTPSMVRAGTASIVCVPLGPAKTVKGAVYLSSSKPKPPFPRAALQLVTSMATQVGLALENLTLLDRLRLENLALRTATPAQEELVGSSGAMVEVRRLIDKVAVTNATVLITGESGTGKELIARAIHGRSSRRDRPMVSLNCGAIPDSTVESELFGHEKGAFTGATERKLGKFELASNGTLFLDEIGELSPGTQVKLLRVLESGTFYRVGGERPVEVDVRIIAATNADLDRKEREGSFRRDLLYRLKIFLIGVPPLKERPGDIQELARYLLSQIAGAGHCRITGDGMKRLAAYPWPGNVRELRNLIEREVILADDGGNLDFKGLDPLTGTSADSVGPTSTLKEAEKAHILTVLKSVGWNKKRAAEILGIGRPTLYDRMKQFGIENQD